MTIEPAAGSSEEVNTEQAHPWCFACGLKNPWGLKLIFFQRRDGSVKADVLCRPEYQGYAGLMHGGLIATVLDEAMTQCLLARRCYALTAKMDIRYVQPVRVNTSLSVQARIKDSHAPLYVLEAELFQKGTLAARATAKFVESREAYPHAFNENAEVP